MELSDSTVEGVVAYDDGDYSKALDIFRPLAENGGAIAQFYLARMYAQSIGVGKDYVEAIKWYTLAADQGHVDAPFWLGQMFHFGKVVLQNNKTAVKWYTLAVEQGHVEAQQGLDLIAEAEFIDEMANLADLQGSEKNIDLYNSDQGAGYYGGNYDAYIVSEYMSGKSVQEIIDELSIEPDFACKDPSDIWDDVVMPALVTADVYK